MGKKTTAFALAALLMLGLTGCGSGNNVTTDRSYGTRGTYDNGVSDAYNNGTNGNNGMMGNNGSMGNGAGRSNGTLGNGGMNGNGGTNSNGGNTGSTGRSVMDNIGNGIGNTMGDLGEAIEDAGDTLTGDNNRYQEMLENGRVHDTDGYLLDGENRHD